MADETDFFKRENDEFRDTAVGHIKGAEISFENVSNVRKFRTTRDCSNLVKIFGKCISDEEYTESNSLYKLGNKHCLRFEISFPRIGKTVTLYCNKSKDQPGNGEIHGCKSYSYYENKKVDGFANFFRQFLKGKIENTEQDFDTKFELSELFAFEIARWLQEGRPYCDVPVAVAIFMAMTLSLQPQELFNVFRGTREQRMSAFWEIHAKYKQEGHRDPTAKVILDVFIYGSESVQEPLVAVATGGGDDPPEDNRREKPLGGCQGGDGRPHPNKKKKRDSPINQLFNNLQNDLRKCPSKKREAVLKQLKRNKKKENDFNEEEMLLEPPLKNPDGNEKDDVSEEFERKMTLSVQETGPQVAVATGGGDDPPEDNRREKPLGGCQAGDGRPHPNEKKKRDEHQNQDANNGDNDAEENTVDNDGDDDDDRNNDDDDEDDDGDDGDGEDGKRGQRTKRIGNKTEEMKTPKILSPSEESKKIESAPISIKSSGACHQNGVKKT